MHAPGMLVYVEGTAQVEPAVFRFHPDVIDIVLAQEGKQLQA